MSTLTIQCSNTNVLYFARFHIRRFWALSAGSSSCAPVCVCVAVKLDQHTTLHVLLPALQAHLIHRCTAIQNEFLPRCIPTPVFGAARATSDKQPHSGGESGYPKEQRWRATSHKQALCWRCSSALPYCTASSYLPSLRSLSCAYISAQKLQQLEACLIVISNS